MPQLRRHAVAVAGGSGGGIADTAGGQHHRLRRVGILLTTDAGDSTFLCLDGNRPVVRPVHLQAIQSVLQSTGYIEGAIRLGKDPVAPLRF